MVWHVEGVGQVVILECRSPEDQEIARIVQQMIVFASSGLLTCLVVIIAIKGGRHGGQESSVVLGL